MDGDPVEGEPSDDLQTNSITELFYHAFPYYLAIGMSYDEFWHGTASLVRAYRKAQKIRMQNEEWARWRSGLYIYDSLLRVSPVLRAFAKGDVKPLDYPHEPYPLTEEEARRREEKREKENYERYIARMESMSAREMARRTEAAKEEAEHAGECED